MILVISAMDEEAREIIKLLENKKTIVLEEYGLNKELYIGQIGNHEVISLTTGIGKVNASTWTSYVLSKYKVTHIINSGSAGGIKEDSKMDISDIIISSEVAFHDFDLTKFGRKIGEIPGLPQKYKTDEKLLQKALKVVEEKITNIKAHVGLILTGDQFIEDKIFLSKIKQNFQDALAVEMEAAAIAQVAYIFKIPFIITRAVSDLPGNKDNHIDFDKFLETAARNSAIIVKELIRLI